MSKHSKEDFELSLGWKDLFSYNHIESRSHHILLHLKYFILNIKKKDVFLSKEGKAKERLI